MVGGVSVFWFCRCRFLDLGFESVSDGVVGDYRLGGYVLRRFAWGSGLRFGCFFGREKG